MSSLRSSLLSLPCGCRTIRRAALTALLLASLPAPGAGQPPPWSALPARWQRALAAVDQRLRAGEWERARAAASDLERDLARRHDLDAAGAQALALACALRATAESGLERFDEALWTWRTAAAIDPGAAQLDLGAYGDPGHRLASTPFRERHAAAAPERAPGQTPPEPRKRPRPRLPRGLAHLGVDTEYAVQVLVGADGHPREPLVVRRPSYPSLIYELLETVRRWEFTPAQAGGQAAEALYTVSTPFDLP